MSLAARLLVGLRAYLVPELPDDTAPVRASERGRDGATGRRRARHADPRPPGRDIAVRPRALLSRLPTCDAYTGPCNREQASSS